MLIFIYIFIYLCSSKFDKRPHIAQFSHGGQIHMQALKSLVVNPACKRKLETTTLEDVSLLIQEAS